MRAACRLEQAYDCGSKKRSDSMIVRATLSGLLALAVVAPTVNALDRGIRCQPRPSGTRSIRIGDDSTDQLRYCHSRDP